MIWCASCGKTWSWASRSNSLAKPPCSPPNIVPVPPLWVKQLDHYTPQFHHAQSTASSSQNNPTTAVRRRITGKQKPTNDSSQTTVIIPSGAASSSSSAFPKRGIGWNNVLVECYCGMQWCSFKPQLLLGSSGELMGISGEFPWTAVRNHLAPFLSPQHAGRLALLDHLWRLLHGNIIRHGNIGQNGDAVCNPGAVLLHPSESSESTWLSMTVWVWA